MDRMEAWRLAAARLKKQGWLTGKGQGVLLVLFACIEAGHTEPTHSELGRSGEDSISTVQRTLRTARRLGLIEWQHCYVMTPAGPRQTANRYRLVLDHAPVTPRPRRLVSQVDRPRRFKRLSRLREAVQPLFPAPPAVPIDLLALRQAKIMADLAAGWRPAHR